MVYLFVYFNQEAYDPGPPFRKLTTSLNSSWTQASPSKTQRT